MKKILIFALFFTVTVMLGTELDKGGVSFDFKKISDDRFKAASEVSSPDNLVTDPEGQAESSKDPMRWQGNYCSLHTRDIPQNDPRRVQIRKIIKWSVADGVFHVFKPDELSRILPENVVRSTSGGWAKFIELPDDRGGLFSLTCEFRASIKGRGSCYLLVYGSNEPAGKWKKRKQPFFKIYPLYPSDTWQNYRYDIMVPQGCRSLRLIWRIDGLGTMDFRKPALKAVSAAEADGKLTLSLSPMAFLDHTFALAQGLPGTLAFAWKRNGTPAEARMTAPELVVVLPKEISFHESPKLKLLSRKSTPSGIEYRIDLSSRRKQPAAFESYDFQGILPLLISTQSAPNTAISEGIAWVEEKGRRLSNVEKIKFMVIPAFRAEKPDFFLPGIYLGGSYSNHTGDNIGLCARMYDAAGVRWIISVRQQQPAFPVWRKAGVKVITPELYYVRNGFVVGRPEGRPEVDKYRFIGPSSQLLAQSTCPAAIYEKRSFYRDHTVPFIRQWLQGANGLWANWEPYSFTGRGCFCDTCRRNFAKFVGVPEDQMKKEWPQELAVGRKYYQQAVRFRSQEHAKLVKTINEAVTAATGGEKSLGFIPGVQADTMSSNWRKNGYDKETHPIDYAGTFRWIDPWGPYAKWKSFTPYVYSKSYNLFTFLSARDVRQGVDRDYAPNPPKLLALVHGIQLNWWITQPESIAIELLAYLFNQWHAATVYHFPKGYDARYWKAFSDAVNTAAEYEKYVFKGKRMDEKVGLTPLNPYASDTAVIDKFLGTYKYYSLLQHTAYELDGKIIIAAFNFWRNGEVFFQCRVKDLEPDTRYTVKCQAGDSFIRFVRDGGASFTGKDLAEGITLHAGAVRCVVYELAPEISADKKIFSLSVSSVESTRKMAKPALTKAKTDDDKYEKLYGPKESKLVNISNDGISCIADPQKKTLTFTCGSNKAEIYAPSLTLTEWTIGSDAVIRKSNPNSGAGLAFWIPPCTISSGFLVKEQKKIPGGLEITGEKLLLDRDRPELSGLVIRQTFRLTKKLAKVEIKADLVNEAERNIHVGVRYNFLIATPGEKDGFTRILSNGKSVDLKRDFTRRLWAVGKDLQFESAIRKLFSVKSETGRIDVGPVFFCKPGFKVKLQIEPQSEIAGVAVWDNASLNGVNRQFAGTFEPCFKSRNLGPSGGSFRFSCALDVEK